ncbi:MAG: thiamine pyrophosphate-binding protein, partial [Actinobacteria bacterium]|nr:thiamine pyrophosphate-binding protein [Actinomycetota bacterium]
MRRKGWHLSRSLTVAQYLAQDLHSRGIEFVYELTGGMIVLLLDAIHTSAEIEIISVHHEQAAGFMAEGQSRVSGKPAVAFATSGPGATNLLTAIASCYFDSSPVVFITGQVNTDELSVNSGRRQGGFQETDIVAMATPVTKWAKRVEDSVAFPEILDEAFNIASSGRQGPVLLDIPM